MAKAAKYIAALGLALACVSALAGTYWARRVGSGAYEASAVAALINWIGGALGLATVVACRNKSWRAHGILLATAVRMALPLVALAYFARFPHPLSAYGVGGLIVVHYLVGLTVETLMSVRLVAAASPHVPPLAAAHDA